MQPWKLLFNVKVLLWLIVLGIGYTQVPSPYKNPINNIFKVVWDWSRECANHLHLTQLIGYGMDGAAEGKKLFSAPNAIPLSPGTSYLYGGWPQGVIDSTTSEWEGKTIAHFSSPNSQWTSLKLTRAEARQMMDLKLPWPDQSDKNQFDLQDEFDAQCRAYAIDDEEIWILLGKISMADKNYWAAVIMDELKQKPRSLAFCFDFRKKKKSGLSQHLTSLQSIDELCGVRLLAHLEPSYTNVFYQEPPRWIW